MISEKLLHFIWQHQYFNKDALVTDNGEPLQIQFPGEPNSNQGPDFLKGRIKVNDTAWIGNIELHINASDWDHHRHAKDVNYNNIILHVVWNNDRQLKTARAFPTLELKTLVPKVMLQRYKLLHDQGHFVPCENFLPTLSKLGWTSWKERLCVERLQLAVKHISQQLEEIHHNWDEIFWWRLARNFGVKLNGDLFEQAAKTVPWTLLAKYRNNPLRIEAMLFGQTNLLPAEANDDYTALLITEFDYAKKLHNLKPVLIQPMYMRMRPAGFPTIRVAQMAALVTAAGHLFRQSLEATDVKQLKKMLQVSASAYWNHHYSFGEVAAHQSKKLGFEMTNNIIINTVVPMVFSHGVIKKEPALKEKALHWLLDLTAEQNQYTRKWSLYNVENNNAFDSQALLQLKTSYCNQRRCLECAIGNQLMAAAAEPAHVN